MEQDLAAFTLSLHGDDVRYVKAGNGPVLVLLHGILGSRRSWAELISLLEQDFTVIAPDLLGHGDSAKPRGDYSLGAHAGRLRDLLDALEVERVTLVGHSLGGGVAMQFVWLFPQRCERLVLVSSGGLGRGYVSLGDAETRRAFLATIRTVVDPGGQTVSALEWLPALARTPTLLVWGARDRLIPVAHGVAAQQAIPGSRLEVFEQAGHLPHLSDPPRFAALLQDFVATTPAPEAGRVERRRRRASRGARRSA